MLVLTRKVGQKIRLAEDITVTILEVRGDRVRVGIDAPLSVSVHREEVFHAIKRTGGKRPIDSFIPQVISHTLEVQENPSASAES